MPIKGDARSTTMTLGCSLLTLKIRLSGEEKRERSGWILRNVYIPVSTILGRGVRLERSSEIENWQWNMGYFRRLISKDNFYGFFR